MEYRKLLSLVICLSFFVTACSFDSRTAGVISEGITAIEATGDIAYMNTSSFEQRNIDFSQPLKAVPESYLTESDMGGTVVRLNYETSAYSAGNQNLSKHAYVYLPYGYNGENRYDIFYLLHGGGSAEGYFGGENQSTELKRILDHMIADGELEPLIVVTPTFYPSSSTDNSVATAGDLTANFHNELIHDLVPAVESTYSTYAGSVDAEGLRLSREHRAFGGFSMGSVTTWYTFIHCLDYFKYYMPISGDSWIIEQRGGSASAEETAAYLDRVVEESGYGPEDYFIYALTGTSDMAYEPMNSQIEAMKNYEERFIFVSDTANGNIIFRVKEGGAHDYTNVRLYVYNALPTFWSNKEAELPESADKAQNYGYTTQALPANRDGKEIYGVVYVPEGIDEPMPTVIYAHGLGGTHQSGAQYAGAMARQGYVAYSFDFIGGSTSSRSEGTTLEMSVFTEQADLEAVISMLSALDYVDSNNIFLLGSSQGGAVSAITAADNIDQIQGVILLYPAFVIADNAKDLFGSINEIPDTHYFRWITVGRIYFENLLDYDFYEHIKKYEKDVLIIHGDRDSLVPLSYSQQALGAYSSSRLEVISGAGHGFYGDEARQVNDYILEYIEAHLK